MPAQASRHLGDFFAMIQQMEREITKQHGNLTYMLKKSKRARRMRLAVHENGVVVVTLPHNAKESSVERFILEKIKWIFAKLAVVNKFKHKSFAQHTRGDYLLYKERAFLVIKEKIEYFANIYGYPYKKISIRNQKTRWGSCSKNGNLNFNYKIMFLPKHIQDYIIAHEFCHLKELNHSKQFWNLLLRVFPEYLQSRRQLKEYSLRKH